MAGRYKKLSIVKETDSGCYEITSHAPGTGGYHKVWADGKRQMLHRFIYEQAFGVLDIGLVVRHKCDNTSCIRLDHLESGTMEDNIQDSIKRGRFKFNLKKGHTLNTGIAYDNCSTRMPPNSKINPTIVKEIRSSSLTINELALKYAVTKCTIRDILKRKTWKMVV